jgi:hypothetical protein
LAGLDASRNAPESFSSPRTSSPLTTRIMHNLHRQTPQPTTTPNTHPTHQPLRHPPLGPHLPNLPTLPPQ